LGIGSIEFLREGVGGLRRAFGVYRVISSAQCIGLVNAKREHFRLPHLHLVMELEFARE
jgi:hypothetical protein